ncbi:hypothetical protein COCSADRAFT_168947 [Bipolaris sorokiniana ND90Pr]|uniref:Uncharacterized protein n=1 Tax=Cochliobolus sativus (strain ND90Pr / ATCC 201652) TaxID=665912 RepID=M2RMC5_COCSN|nr:uncharacterized protein COCSADRAFT_168947 [Bipolaris sorokiniana ND90Pr]EMD67779.1 hypothetical protein COCSADRAFT_168947 [Bipolaris sorokiniana ND90Pr]
MQHVAQIWPDYSTPTRAPVRTHRVLTIALYLSLSSCQFALLQRNCLTAAQDCDPTLYPKSLVDAPALAPIHPIASAPPLCSCSLHLPSDIHKMVLPHSIEPFSVASLTEQSSPGLFY